MLSTYAEKFLARTLSYGSALTALLVISSSVTDPVNSPKLASLGVVAFGALGIVLASWNSIRFQFSPMLTSGLLIFLLAATSAAIFSQSPGVQNLWGLYGRNNGLITYIFLAAIFISASVLSQAKSHESIAKGLLVAGLVNIVYCGWVIVFGDFIGWSNPYGNILGTFGNPNFIGAFLGIFVSAYLAYCISPQRTKIWKLSLLLVVPVTLIEIVESSAIQGRVVAAGGFALVAFSYLRFRIGKFILGLYTFAVTAIGIFAVLGALQIGPLTHLIYKTSVSLRGQYWLAGWNAGERNPLTGVGMDGLGDWYRRVRDPEALQLPGVNTVVNASHNVFMDMFAFGGWPLFISYIFLVCYSAYALIRTSIRLESYDGTFAAISVAWIGYQVQSVISINQIGLAIWGWLLGGTLIAYERISRPATSAKTFGEAKTSALISKTRKNSSGSESKILLISTGLAMVGLIIALPPVISDSTWKSSISGQSVIAIQESMKPSFFNPPNVNKYLTNIQLLEKNSFQDLAHRYALEAVKWNPQSYDSWRLLYFIEKSTPKERARALAKMKELDPLNPDVAKP
jgi:hypothetical protein